MKIFKYNSYFLYIVKMNNINIDNVCDYNKLNNIREIIENMDKENQIEILRILSKYKDVTINENKYGIHINLSELKIEIIKELIVYINYIAKQEIELNNIELEQENYKNIFSKEKK